MKKIILIFALIILLTGFSSAYECYQEYANRSTACGGLSNGSYNYDTGAAWVDVNNIYDGDWSTFGHGNYGTGDIMFVNYTKPTNAISAILQFKTNAHFINNSIPQSCFNGYTDKIVIEYFSGGNLAIECHTSATTKTGLIGSTGGSEWYEEAIIWEISEYPLFYNTTAYETSLQQFTIFINDSGSVSSAYLNYSGTLTSASVLNLAGTSTITANKYIPANTGVKNISFIVNYQNGSTYNSVIFNQEVLPISFGLCNSSLNTKYLNITFTNETTSLQRVGAALSASIYYSLSDLGQVNKSYSMVNSTEYKEYDFCFGMINGTLDTYGQLQYHNSESITRSYTLETTLTNIQSKLNLFLLPTSSGIYSRYKVVTTTGTVISGVLATVKRTIAGTEYSVGTGVTDSAGQVVFFLNPDATYDYTFTKTGYATNSFSLNPNSVETYTITLSGSATVYNYTKIGNNLSYSIIPTGSNLTNNSNIGFAFTVSGTDISFISMNITNLSGTQLYYGTLSGAGTVSQTVNIGNNTEIIGYFKIIADGETFAINKKWIVYNVYVGDYSLFKQLNLFNDYNFSPIFRVLIILAVFLIVGIMLSGDKPFEDNSPQLVVYMLLVWAFSIVGWLNTGITQGSNILSESANQYGIAILTTVAGMALIFRREWS